MHWRRASCAPLSGRKAKDSVQKAIEQLSTSFSAEPAISAIGKALSDRWDELHDGTTDKTPGLALISQRFEEVVAKVQVLFDQSLSETQSCWQLISNRAMLPYARGL